jgi:hypothetical protein
MTSDAIIAAYQAALDAYQLAQDVRTRAWNAMTVARTLGGQAEARVTYDEAHTLVLVAADRMREARSLSGIASTPASDRSPGEGPSSPGQLSWRAR